MVPYTSVILFTLSRSADRENTSPGLSRICRRISSTGNTVLPVMFTSPTLNWGPSTTTIRMVARALIRSTWMSDDSTRAWM